MHRSHKLCLVLMLCSFASRAQITSTFEADADGWTIFFGASGAWIPGTYSSTGGNPNGHASLTYSTVTSSVQYWITPSKFLGNIVVRSLGMSLQFDLRQSIASTASGPQGDVRIESQAGTLVYVFPTIDRPTTSWKTYTIRLDETGGWRWNTTGGAVATRSQVIAVLTNVTAIEIAASYAANASYTAQIDNVILDQKALGIAPIITSFTPLSGDPGSQATITGSGFNSLGANNSVYFSGLAANIVSASSTQLVVNVPQSAMHGPITVVNKATGLVSQSLQSFSPTFPDGGRIIPASLKTRVDITVAGSTEVNGLAVADLDGDGWTDIAMSESGNTISIFRNLGNGGDITTSSFAAKVSLTGAGNSSGMRITDIDGDGQLDLIANAEISSLVYFATYRNISTPGNLAFEPVKLWYGLVYSGSLSSVADVDGDGRVDLIGQHSSSSTFVDFWIAQNISTPGNIEFAASQSYFGNSTLDAGDGVTAADLDNDGKPEMIVEHSFGNQFQIIKNNSTPGTIAFGTPFAISESVNGGVAVADLNGDGLNDLVFKQGFSNDDVNIRLNTYAGGTLSASDFPSQIVLNTDITNYGGVSIADINGDGKVDLVASDASNITVFENVYNGGVFNASAFVRGFMYEGAGNSTYPTTPVNADFNGDNKLDILVGITNTNPVRLGIFENANIHAPVISLTTVSPLKGPVGSTVAITGNYFSTVPTENIVKFGGVRADVLTATKTRLTVQVPAGAGYAPVSVTKDELTARYHLPFNVIFSSGITAFSASTFSPPIDFTMTTPDFDIDVADLNGDNKLDIVAEGASQFSYIFRNDYTSGALSTSSLILDHTTATAAANPKLIDLDGDDKADIVSVSGIYKNTSTPSDISFATQTAVGGTTNIGFADFNLDGRYDYIGASATSFQLLENRTRPGNFVTGTFASVGTATDLGAGGTTVGTAAADFDNDGYADAATTITADAIVVSRNTGATRVINTAFTSAGSFASLDLPGRIYEADLDVDGKIDLMVYYQTNGVSTAGHFWSVFRNTSSPGSISFTRIDYQVGTASSLANIVCGPSTISDLDGDGRPEVIITSASTTAANQGFIVFKNNTTPGTITTSSFTSSGLVPLAGARAVIAGDLNSDSKPELIFTRTGSRLTVVESQISISSLSFPVQPVSTVLCDLPSTTLTVSATGDTNLQYQWQQLNTVSNAFEDLVDNSTFAGVNTSSLTITNPTSSTTFRAVVQGDYTFAPSASATIVAETKPAPPLTVDNSACEGSSVSLSASGATDGQYRWYDVSTGGTVIPGALNSSFNTTPLNTTTQYYVAINNGNCESDRAIATATINTVAAPVGVDNFRCGIGSVSLSATGGTSGNYRWYETSTIGVPIGGEVSNTFATPPLNSTTTYYVSLTSGACESLRTAVTATVTLITAPTPTPAVRCGQGSVTLWASGGVDGNFRWYEANALQPITGAVNASYSTPSISSSKTYFVALSDGTCESEHVAVTATVNSLPPTPTISANNVNAGVISICNGTVVLSAPTGYSYAWSNGATIQDITVPAGTYSLEVIDANNCRSAPSNQLSVVIDPTACNTAPVITPTSLTTSISGSVEITLSEIISDAENNFQNVIIVNQPQSGATATIVNGVLIIDYSTTNFSGRDVLKLRACDAASLCSEEVTITIDVIGDIIIYNAISPNNDDSNEYFRIEYIDIIELTKTNKVTIYNRWGDVVFQVQNYDNTQRVFKGFNQKGSELPSGTYFYKIEFIGTSAPPTKTGYLTLKR